MNAKEIIEHVFIQETKFIPRINLLCEMTDIDVSEATKLVREFGKDKEYIRKVTFPDGSILYMRNKTFSKFVHTYVGEFQMETLILE